ncbi:hypothetical protein So717_01110 [Roseobacter cerasinus]|uniref:Uncharacterized protein n=1 Tax=Roseobacter cerasinus TaxID=2602289 RepID=A0A640VIJ5_9RHOB|nr:hypothetical protein So717_01110 [Roseobacter cerasinus]
MRCCLVFTLSKKVAADIPQINKLDHLIGAQMRDNVIQRAFCQKMRMWIICKNFGRRDRYAGALRYRQAASSNSLCGMYRSPLPLDI